MTKIKEDKMQDWAKYFSDRGVSPHLAQQYIDYIKKLDKSNLPVIFELEHLSKLIGIKLEVLRKITANSRYFYREFTIQKRRGGRRLVSAPYPSLLMCQTWIYENILKLADAHFSSHGYCLKKSIKTNATPHLNQNALLKMDMKDFFPSIPINWVINYFSNLGYPNNVAYYLSAICCLDDALPQGAPTSPALSNILLMSLDKRLYRLSKQYKLNYTRYADDLTFSGGYIPNKLISVITQIVSDYGLSINDQKTSLIIGNKQKIVTGLYVSDDKLKLPRASRRELQKEIYYIKKYGLLSHIGKLKIKQPNYLDSLEGKIRFWVQIEPDNIFAKESLSFLKSLKE